MCLNYVHMGDLRLDLAAYWIFTDNILIEITVLCFLSFQNILIFVVDYDSD